MTDIFQPNVTEKREKKWQRLSLTYGGADTCKYLHVVNGDVSLIPVAHSCLKYNLVVIVRYKREATHIPEVLQVTGHTEIVARHSVLFLLDEWETKKRKRTEF